VRGRKAWKSICQRASPGSFDFAHKPSLIRQIPAALRSPNDTSGGSGSATNPLKPKDGLNDASKILRVLCQSTGKSGRILKLPRGWLQTAGARSDKQIRHPEQPTCLRQVEGQTTQLPNPRKCVAQQTFLGLSHSIARWRVTNDGTQREQPPNSEVMQNMVVVAPHYTGSRTLDGEAEAEG
jgi:hypothetical protein